MAREFVLPDLGEGIAEAQIIRIMVQEGDTVKEDQYLMEVETDKAAVEIPSPFSGVVSKLHVKEGATVNVGDVIVSFNGEGERAEEKEPAKKDARDDKKEAKAEKKEAKAASAEKRETDRAEKKEPRVTEQADSRPSRRTTAAAAPAVRKLARELGVDLDRIEGSGPGGRITREDVERHAGGDGAARPPERQERKPTDRRETAPLPGVADADKWGRISREPLSQIRKTIANQMKRSAFTAVHVTHGDEADISELERTRRRLNELTDNNPKLTVMTLVVRATCLALKKHPIFNASFDEDEGQIIYKEYINLGVAVDTDRGLIVPVIRNADQLGLRGVAAALRSIADRIRSKQFAVEDLRGGTFTITNVGALGGTFSTPIINYPEVAILGLGRSRKMPVFRDGQLAEALILPVAVTFDHRATDGANAARFTRDIISFLEEPARFLLD